MSSYDCSLGYIFLLNLYSLLRFMECQPVWQSFGMQVVIIENKEECVCEDIIWFSTLLSNMPPARGKSVSFIGDTSYGWTLLVTMCIKFNMFNIPFHLFMSPRTEIKDAECLSHSLEMKIIFSYLDFGWWTLQVFMKSFSIDGIVLGKATITSDELMY